VKPIDSVQLYAHLTPDDWSTFRYSLIQEHTSTTRVLRGGLLLWFTDPSAKAPIIEHALARKLQCATENRPLHAAHDPRVTVLVDRAIHVDLLASMPDHIHVEDVVFGIADCYLTQPDIRARLLATPSLDYSLNAL